MPDSQSKNVLTQIPSPSKRLWAGLGIILVSLVFFAGFALHEVRWLQNFQATVVQMCRKASLQLTRLQDDRHMVVLSLREMIQGERRYPHAYWRAEFRRLRKDTDEAVDLVVENSAGMPEATADALHLRSALVDFWCDLDKVLAFREEGQEAEARNLVDTEIEIKQAKISDLLARMLLMNDKEQAQASEEISSVYAKARRNILIAVAILLLLGLGTGVYTLQANRKTFEKLRQLARRLEAQSEQLRKLSWKLIEVQEETLRHVARDLHDEFGQILTAIGATLARAGHKASAGDPVWVQEVETVQKLVEETLQGVRDRSQMFRPAILDDFGLQQTLEWFVEQFARQTGLRVNFEGKMRDGVFPSEDGIHLYRIVQEALNNVARHARARQAWVTLKEQDGELKLGIRDNGVGFEVGAEMSRPVGSGVGLMGMRERAEHLNGSFTIQATPGKGTLVEVSIPLKRSGVRTATA